MSSVIKNNKIKIRRYAFVLLFFVAFSIGNVTFADEAYKTAKDLSNAFSSAAERAMPAVVSIKVEKTIDASQIYQGDQQLNDQFGNDFFRQFFGGQIPQLQTPRKYKEEGQGSGFIISKDGYILTNNHVVGDVDKITVELKDGRKFTNAKVIGTDPGTEVALIKIDGDGDFPVLPMGDSNSNKIGDWVIAIGNPFGLSETVTVGVISAVGRNKVGIANYENFIQTDAAINPGNSGGPLINLDGQVIGINTAIYSESGGYMGIGFAIPIDMARNIEKQLKENGKVIRGYLGIYCQDITPEMAKLLDLSNDKGIIVATVENGSPADKGGLKNQDIILEMNGETVKSYDTFRNKIANIKPDSVINLTILRDGKKQDLKVTLGERPTDGVAKALPKKEQPKSKEALGIEVQNVTNDIARQLGYKVGEGVIVTSVDQGSPASDAGIESGDLILSVNRQNVNSDDEFEKAISNIKGNKVMLLVKHGDYSQFVVIELTQ